MPSLYISPIITSWYDIHRRQLPWRETDDPYKIWLSEIILQQTRVAQGMDYYYRFTEHYPTLHDLAAAPLDEVMKLWQGLGYYSRARNLHTAARQVIEEFGGEFPTHYKDLIRLKGIGKYTAAAIASFTSGEAVAVIDGNVYRLLSRLFDIATPIDTGEGEKLFRSLAEQLLDPHHAGKHNQAMMEFGAMQCVPGKPQCERCPLVDHCLSYERGTIEIRPVKKQKIAIKQRYLHYLIFHHDGEIIVRKRDTADIWRGLYEFVLWEDVHPCPPDQLLSQVLSPTSQPPQCRITPIALQLKHRLTHRDLLCDFYLIESDRPIEISQLTDSAGYIHIKIEDWEEYAVPKPISEINKQLFSLISCKAKNK